MAAVPVCCKALSWACSRRASYTRPGHESERWFALLQVPSLLRAPASFKLLYIPIPLPLQRLPRTASILESSINHHHQDLPGCAYLATSPNSRPYELQPTLANVARAIMVILGLNSDSSDRPPSLAHLSRALSLSQGRALQVARHARRGLCRSQLLTRCSAYCQTCRSASTRRSTCLPWATTASCKRSPGCSPAAAFTHVVAMSIDAYIKIQPISCSIMKPQMQSCVLPFLTTPLAQRVNAWRPRRARAQVPCVSCKSTAQPPQPQTQKQLFI